MDDLFETPELLPESVQQVLNQFSEQEQTYENCAALQKALEPLGYTFDYYLDAVPTDLRKIEDKAL